MLEYKDLEVRAASGLHEDCLTIIQRHVPKGAGMIDLAAGAGAFSARLVWAKRIVKSVARLFIRAPNPKELNANTSFICCE